MDFQTIIITYLTIISSAITIIEFFSKNSKHKFFALSLTILFLFITSVVLVIPKLKTGSLDINFFGKDKIESIKTDNIDTSKEILNKPSHKDSSNTQKNLYSYNNEKDKKILALFNIAKNIKENYKKSDELLKLVKYSLDNKNVDFSILMVNEIPYYNDKSIAYGLIIDYLLLNNNPQKADSLIKKIPFNDHKTTNIKKIINYCLKNKLYEEAILVSDMFPYNEDAGEYKAKIIEKMKK